MVVFISIGNSDDKLTQAHWADLVAAVDEAVLLVSKDSGIPSIRAALVHGRWFSLPHDKWQNATWCVEFTMDPKGRAAGLTLRANLALIADQFDQESIAWNHISFTEFIRRPNRQGGGEG